ncbi:MAG TPA: tetratricopeptide repeat protein [Armatimonadota bacterium]|nr:tetratricopeptide repeat protein [Armatimonadota bacterium]
MPQHHRMHIATLAVIAFYSAVTAHADEQKPITPAAQSAPAAQTAQTVPPAQKAPAAQTAPAPQSTQANNSPAIQCISRADVEVAWQAASKLRGQDNLNNAAVMSAFAAQFPDTDYARQALYQVGAAYQAQRLFPEAVAAFNNYLARYPGHDQGDDALLQIATILTSEKEDEGAAAAYLDFQRRFPRNAQADDALLNAAAAFTRAKNTDAALAAYQALADTYPASELCDDALWAKAQLIVTTVNQQAQDNVAVVQYNDYGPAIQIYQYIVARLPFSRFYDDAAYQIAYLNYPARQYTQAVDALEEFIRCYPGSTMIPQARSIINAALRAQRMPDRYDVKEKLPTVQDFIKPADRLRAERRWGDTIAVYQAALQQFPGYDQRDQLLMQIGDTYDTGGDTLGAIKAWRAVVDGCPGSDLRIQCMGKIVTALQKVKDIPASIQAESDYATLFPNGANTEKYLSDIRDYYRSERAVPALLVVLKNLYANYRGTDLCDDALYEAAGIALQQRRYSEAAALYAQLARDYPGSNLAADALFLLARCQEELNRSLDAQKSYQQVIALLPHTGLADDAYNALRTLQPAEETARNKPAEDASLPEVYPGLDLSKAKWEAFKDPAEPMLEGLYGPISSFPGAHAPLVFQFKMAKRLPVLLEIKWLSGDTSFMNMQVYCNNEFIQSVYVKPDSLTQLKIPATKTVEGPNTLQLVSCDMGMHWDCLRISSDGLPAERGGVIQIGVPDAAYKEFSAGIVADAKAVLTVAVVNLDEKKWTSFADPQQQALKAAVAAATPGKDGKPRARKPADIYTEQFEKARGYYARGYFTSAAKTCYLLTREPLPAIIQNAAQALWLMAGENARDYGLEEIRRGGLVLLAPPAVAMQLRAYNVPDYYQQVLDIIGVETTGTELPRFVISSAMYPAGSGALLARFQPAWCSDAGQWATILPPFVHAMLADPAYTRAMAEPLPNLGAAMERLASLAAEVKIGAAGWNTQQLSLFDQKRRNLFVASANTVANGDPKKVSADALAGWLLRMALGEGFLKSKPEEMAWDRLGGLLRTLRSLPQPVLDRYNKPADRTALFVWALRKHLGKEALVNLKYLGLRADERMLAEVAATLEKPKPKATAENRS